MMFNSLTALAALTTVALASHGRIPSDVSRRHHELAARAPEPEPEAFAGNGTHVLEKRAFTNARATWYDVGLGACGDHNVAGDFIVAMNTPQYGKGYPGPHCGDKIKITYKGITAIATVKDECPGCGYGMLDFSKGLFTHFAPLGAGVIYMSWSFVGEDDDPAPAPKPKPTTTKKPIPKPTHTPEPEPEKPSSLTHKTTSTHKSTSTHKTTTSKHTTASSTTTTTTPTATPTVVGPQNILGLEQAVIGFANVMAIAAGVNVDAEAN
ncbi:hypothetical protein EXIGLDRAFT_779671 [Exidia glandulosa HHB12029]|uniref:RlpA-like protein double-psi beta-barrel domain-containing protein n=1 Tax=Exidia glandulosa HHB12029 TaxID=1314781 RepID=A0A165BYM4_EXIGL|nr:hypothetical protein EXIGLDRAFT_779671 [Exidia glandulosa HHB12029]